MQVKRVSLELGGKAPFVVFDDADVEAAARAAIFGMFRNAGQACGATARLLLHEGIHDRFLSRVLELTSQIDVGHPADQFTGMGSADFQQSGKDSTGLHQVGPRCRIRAGYRW